MCGILGVYKYCSITKNDTESVCKGAEIIKHRGPDYMGVWSDNNISLAHDKLSILDFSECSNQPIELENVVVAFNGEIYNYKELIKKHNLPDFGIDAHVIAHLYEKMGIDCICEIEGAFAIAIYDKRSERFYLVRDRIGVKPVLYRFTDDGKFYFSSEAKAFKAFDDVKLKVNRKRIAADLVCWFWADKFESYFEDIYHVRAGQYMCIDKGKMTMHTYWDIPHNIRDVKDEELKATLKKATLDRLQGSAKYATLLSGGLDSSLLTGIIASNVDKVTSYTICYDDSENNIDLNYAKEVVDMYSNINHNINYVSKEKITDEFVRKVTYHLEEVVWDKVYCSMYTNYNRAVEDGYRIIINGQGSDECLVGYYNDFLHYSFNKEQLSSVDYMFDYFVDSNIVDGSILNKNSLEEIKDYLGYSLKKNLPDNLSEYSSKDAVAHWAMKTYLQANLVQEDRMSMANSCECRVPFTNYKFVELAFSLVGDEKVVGANEKAPLKRIGKEYLPQSIINRQKQAFVNPKENYNTIAFDYIKSNKNKITESEVFKYVFTRAFLENIDKCDFRFNTELAWKIMAISVFEEVFK